MDFVDFLGPDTSISVLLRLDDPADVARAAAVSRAWRRLVITNGICKNPCLRIYPEVSEFSCVTEVNASWQNVAEVGFSSGMEWESLQKEHKIYSYLSHCLVSPVGKMNCIFDSVGASSTDNYPEEGIQNTLEPRARVDGRPSCWCSGGQCNPEVPETLTYRLCSTLCLIDEIKIKPFKVFFQYGKPIYSARAVQFRLGYSRSTQQIENMNKEAGNNVQNATGRADDNYVWAYVSPTFPMLQVTFNPYVARRKVILATDVFWQSECLHFASLAKPHYPERVLRQYGYIQTIPHESLVSVKVKLGVDARNYTLVYPNSAYIWERWEDHLIGVSRRGQMCAFDDVLHEEYMRTHRSVAPHHARFSCGELGMDYHLTSIIKQTRVYERHP